MFLSIFMDLWTEKQKIGVTQQIFNYALAGILFIFTKEYFATIINKCIYFTIMIRDIHNVYMPKKKVSILQKYLKFVVNVLKGAAKVEFSAIIVNVKI